MIRQVSIERRPWLRTAIYTFMTLAVTVVVSLLMLVVLGYSFNQKDGRLEQGGLLQFSSIPNGATVTLDQLKLGSLTTTKSTAETGNHFVTFDLDGYRQWQKSITINPGQIGWLSYARLIPKTITLQKEHDYTALAGALASQNRKYMLLHETADQPVFTLVDIQGDTPKYTTLTLPVNSFTQPAAGKTQTFTLDSWSRDDQAVLIRHTYDGTKTEWLLLDRNSPEKSINLSVTYAVAPSRVLFAGNGNKLLFVQTDDVVRRLDLGAQTLSRPLATGVDNFTGYDEKTIVYATKPDDKGARTVGYAAVDISNPQPLAAYPADGLPLFGAMSSYFGQKYVAIVHGQNLIIQTGQLPAPNDDGSLKLFAKHTVPAGVTAFDMSNNGRFAVASLPTGYATFDIELQKYDNTTWSRQTQMPRSLNWLDDYMLWSDYGGTLRFYEFDGANQQDIMPVVEGYVATLTPNDKYVYGISKTDKGFALERAKLVIN